MRYVVRLSVFSPHATALPWDSTCLITGVNSPYNRQSGTQPTSNGDLKLALSVNSVGWELPAGDHRKLRLGFENVAEEIQVLGCDLVDKVRDLIHEGNVQRIVVKDEHAKTFVEIPVTVAAVGAILAPLPPESPALPHHWRLGSHC